MRSFASLRMTNELDRRFQDLKRRRAKALIAYLAGGYPRFDEEERLIRSILDAGVDIVEVGIPFSDPIADGPTIQFASQAALENGASLKKILRWIASLKKRIDAPVVIMSYINPIMAYKLKSFAADAARAGVSGVIVPDVIPEESGEIRRALAGKNIHLIHLVAPTTPESRQATIARDTGGFLYAVSVAGVTGARKQLPKETAAWLKRLQAKSRRPVCVGFGISGPEHVRALRNGVDGFIVGSALVDLIRKNPSGRRADALKKFIRSLSKECRNGR